MPLPDQQDQSCLPQNGGAQARLLWAAQIAFLPTGILTTLLGPMLPILIARWGLSDTRAGNCFLVQFLASLAGVQLSGVLLAKFGFRTPFVLGLLFMAVGMAAFFQPSAWLGLVAVAIYGCGLGLIIPTDNLLVAEITSNSSASALTRLNFFWAFGAVLCSVLVGWAHVHQLLALVFLIVSVLIFLLAFAVWGLPFPEAIPRTDVPVMREQVWKTRSAWLFIAVFFLYPGAETAIGGWVGSYLTRIGAHPSMAPLMPAFFWLALTLGRGAGAAVLHRWQEQRVLQIGYGLGSAGIAALIWSSSLTGVIASTMIIGLSFSTLYPIAIAQFSRRFGADARRLGAVMFSMSSLGPAVVPWLVGVSSNATGNLRAGLVVPLAATTVLLGMHLIGGAGQREV